MKIDNRSFVLQSHKCWFIIYVDIDTDAGIEIERVRFQNWFTARNCCRFFNQLKNLIEYLSNLKTHEDDRVPTQQMNQHCPTVEENIIEMISRIRLPRWRISLEILRNPQETINISIKPSTFRRISSVRRHRRPTLLKIATRNKRSFKSFFRPRFHGGHSSRLMTPLFDVHRLNEPTISGESLSPYVGQTSTCDGRIQFIVRAINGESSTRERWLFDHTQRWFICD